VTDYVLPLNLRQARSSFRYVDSTGVTRGAYTGVPQTTNYGGDRIGATIDFTPMGGKIASDQSLRRQLIAMLMRLRGRTNRVYLRDSSYVQGGSFSAPELFSNSDFSTSAGWTVDAGTLSASDGVMRLTADQGGASTEFRQQVTLAAYTPYALRSIILDGAQSSGLQIGTFLSTSGSDGVSDYQTTRGYRVSSGVSVAAATLNQYPTVFGTVTGFTAGAYVLVPFTSLSRCFLVDGGANLLLRSDEFDNASWVNFRSTDAANAATAPDGTATADSIIEDATASNTHGISQQATITSPAAEVCFCVALKAGTRTWARLTMTEATGATVAGAYFDVANAVVGTLATGAQWANTRAFCVPLGSGWSLCYIVSRKTNLATAVTFGIRLATSDGGESYTGNGASLIYAWRATAAMSAVPTRLRQTTSAAASAESQTGSSLFVKGLPESQTGLLLAGDQVEIDGQIKFLTAPLDSNAAGLGHLQFSPPLRRSVADNAPIIVCKPMGRFMIAGDSSGWSNEPGVFSTAALDLEEAFG